MKNTIEFIWSHRSPRPTPFAGWLFLLALTLGLGLPARAQTDSTIYDDAFQNNWGNWGWASTIDTASTAYVHTGSTSIAVTALAWEGFQFGHNWPANFDTTGYGNLTFWINGGPVGGQVLQAYATVNYVGQAAVPIGTIAANTWQKITIPLASLGVDNNANVTSFVIQNTGTDAPTFYVDDIVVTGSVPTIPPPPLNGGMAVYDDALVNGWQNWSWSTTVGTETTIVNSGASSMSVTLAGGGLSLHHADLDTYALMHDLIPLRHSALMVSGRLSFEIVQKAAAAAIPILCAVSAPSSLAVDLAEDLGITLVGFLRESGFNSYTHGERILM